VGIQTLATSPSLGHTKQRVMVYDAACVKQGKQHRQLEILSQHRSEVIRTATMDTINVVSELYVNYDVTYEPFLLPAWAFPVTSGLFCARNVRTISTTSLGLSSYFRTFFFLCTKHTNHFYYQCGAFWFLPDFLCTKCTNNFY